MPKWQMDDLDKFPFGSTERLRRQLTNIYHQAWQRNWPPDLRSEVSQLTHVCQNLLDRIVKLEERASPVELAIEGTNICRNCGQRKPMLQDESICTECKVASIEHKHCVQIGRNGASFLDMNYVRNCLICGKSVSFELKES